MVVTLEEMKNYLRVDYDEDDALIENIIWASERLCMDVARKVCIDMRRRNLLFGNLWNGIRPMAWLGMAWEICCRIKGSGRKQRRHMKRDGRTAVFRQFGICVVS